MKQATLAESSGMISEMFSHLNTCAHALEVACKDVEPAFIQLGQNLQTSYFDAVKLGREVAQTVELIGGSANQEVLNHIGMLARQSLEGLHECRREVNNRLDQVTPVIQYLGELYNMSKGLEKIAEVIRSVGLNLHIESSRSAEYSELSIITQEIKKFSARVIEIATGMNNDSQMAQNSQNSARRVISGNLEQLEKLAGEAEHAVNEALGGIEQLIRNSTQSLEEASIYSQEISTQVGKIVEAIQIHDNISQRIEHIVRALDDAKKIYEHDDDMELSIDESERLGAIYSIIKIQEAQLQEMIVDIEVIYQNTSDAFEEIKNKIEQLGHCLAHNDTNAMHGISANGGTAKDPFGVLQAALQYLQTLVTRSTEMQQQIQNAAIQAAETAGNLSNYTKEVRSVSVKTKFIAFNAIIAAKRLGDKGRTFSVLAQEVKSLSDQVNTFGADVEKLLESLLDCTAKIQLSETSQSEEANQQEALQEGIQRISQVYTQFEENSTAVLQKVIQLKNIVDMSNHLDFFQDLGQAFKKQLQDMQIFSSVVEPWANMAQDPSGKFAHLLNRYTMQKERDIHARLNGADPDASNEPEDDAVEIFSSEDDDLGDNIELF